VKELRYLGVYLVSSSKFKCNFSYAKKAFYRSFNAIFGRVGRLATEEVVLHLIKAKCFPVLLGNWNFRSHVLSLPRAKVP